MRRIDNLPTSFAPTMTACRRTARSRSWIRLWLVISILDRRMSASTPSYSGAETLLRICVLPSTVNQQAPLPWRSSVSNPSPNISSGFPAAPCKSTKRKYPGRHKQNHGDDAKASSHPEFSCHSPFRILICAATSTAKSGSERMRATTSSAILFKSRKPVKSTSTRCGKLMSERRL